MTKAENWCEGINTVCQEDQFVVVSSAIRAAVKNDNDTLFFDDGSILSLDKDEGMWAAEVVY